MTIHGRIRELIRQHGSLRAAARAIKMDHSYLFRLAVGEKTEPSEKVLRKLGLKRVVSYRL